MRSALRGKNADLVAEVARLYLDPGTVVADVTYGRGNFWTRVDTSLFTFLRSDLLPEWGSVDFRELPYEDSSIDTLIMDPPYTPRAPTFNSLEGYNDSYNLPSLKQLGLEDNADLLGLYRAGMAEADRVVKGGGRIWVKCQDTNESGTQRWNHVSVLGIAEDLGWYGRDLFVLLPTAPIPNRWTYQRHSKKVHSYLWIFEKMRASGRTPVGSRRTRFHSPVGALPGDRTPRIERVASPPEA